jgi:hypothetical protein
MVKEHIYKEDKIVEYAPDVFVGFYLGVDDEVVDTPRYKTLADAQEALDKYNKIVAEIKDENEKGE